MRRSIFTLCSLFSIPCTPNKERMFFYQKKVIQTWEHYEHLIESNMSRYKTAIYNYLVFSHSMQQLHEFGEYIERYKKLTRIAIGAGAIDSRQEVFSDFQRLTQLQFILVLNTGELDKAMSLTKEVEDWLSRPGYEEKLSPGALVWIRFSCFVTYFFQERYRESQERVDKIHALAKGQRNDVKLIASMLELIILFELNTDERFQNYKTSSAIHQYKRSRQYRAFEKLVLGNLKKLRNLKGDPKKKLLKFEKAFDAFEQNNAGQQIFGMDEVKVWLKAKVQKKPLKWVAKELAAVNLQKMQEKSGK